MSRRRCGKFQFQAQNEKTKIWKEVCTDERNDNANAKEKAEAEEQAEAYEEIGQLKASGFGKLSAVQATGEDSSERCWLSKHQPFN